MQYTVVKRILLIVLLIMISALGSVKAQIYQIGDVYTFPDSTKGIICYINPDNPIEGWAVALNDVGWVSNTNNKQYFMIDNGTALPAGMVQHPYDAVNGIGRSSLDSWTFEGYENTRLLLNSGHSDAAEAVDFYNGWYIPDAVQLRMIYGLLPIIADKIIEAGGSRDCLEFMYAKNTYGYDYWTSTRINNNQMLVVRGSQYFYQARTPADHNDASHKEKATRNRIRAVRDFGTKAYAYWADSPTDASMVVSPGVGQTSYDAYVIFNSDTVEVVTSSAIVHETYDKDTLYEEVCRSDDRYTSQVNPIFTDLDISRVQNYKPIRKTLQTVHGCDSIITLMLKVNPVYEFNTTGNICQSDTPYVWRNRNFYETGVYYDSLKTTCCNCDSVYVLNLIVAPMPEISFVPENPSVCLGDEIEITASVTNCNDFFQVPLYEGFDGVRGKSSEVLSDANISSMTTMFGSGHLVFSEGDSSIRLGNSSDYGYIVSRQLDLSYDFTLELRMKGWDSQHNPVPTRVMVSIDGVQKDTLTVLGGISGVSPVQYETFSINFNEASSNSVLRIETINERVIDPSADTLYSFAQERVVIDWVRISNNSSCTYSWSAGGSPIPGGSSITVSPEITTTYNVIVQSRSRCKKSASVEVVVNEPTEGDDIVFSCVPYTWIDGITYYETPEEKPSVKLQDHNGCDSTVTLHLTIGHTVGEFSVIACGSYTWEGETYTESGDYEHIYTSSEGCDSVVTLHLTVNDTVIPTFSMNEDVCISSSLANDSIEISVQALSGYSYIWNIDGGNFSTSSRTDTNRIVVRWADEGDKTVSVTMRNNATNCESHAEKTIHVHKTPVVEIAAVTDEICPYSGTYEPITATITTTTTADYTYTWGGGVTLTAATTTTSETTNSVSVTIPTVSCDTLYKIGVNVVDGYGCKANADSITLTVRDVEVPTISGTLRDSTVMGCGADDKPFAVNTIDYLKANGLTISDNCTDDAHLTVTSSDADITGTCNKTIIRTYRVIDACGNYSEATQNIYINVQDFTITEPSGSSTVACIANATMPTAPAVTDNCGATLTPIDTSIVDAPDPLTCNGTRTYTFTYKDCANHSHDWTYTYTIDRTGLPSIATGYEDSKTVECLASAVALAPDKIPTATSSCGEAMTGVLLKSDTTWNSGYENCEGTVTFVYKYVDCAGDSTAWTGSSPSVLRMQTAARRTGCRSSHRR